MAWTEERRQLQAEKMRVIQEQKRKARELKAAQQNQTTTLPEPPVLEQQSNTTLNTESQTSQSQSYPTLATAPAASVNEPQQTISHDEYQNLLRQIQELKQTQFVPQYAPQVGRHTGTYEKYSIDPANYPNPVERLMKEPRLSFFAFEQRNELIWKVETSRYQLADQTWEKQPKFTLRLIEKGFNDQGEPLTRINAQGQKVQVKYVLRDFVMHEDPEAAIQIANDNGFQIDESMSKSFLDEMRYLRVRDWLLEKFYPAKSTAQSGMKEEVIGGQLVQIMEVSAEGNAKIPFDQLETKMRA